MPFDGPAQVWTRRRVTPASLRAPTSARLLSRDILATSFFGAAGAGDIAASFTASGTLGANLTTSIRLRANLTASGTLGASLTTSIRLRANLTASGTLTASFPAPAGRARSLNPPIARRRWFAAGIMSRGGAGGEVLRTAFFGPFTLGASFIAEGTLTARLVLPAPQALLAAAFTASLIIPRPTLIAPGRQRHLARAQQPSPGTLISLFTLDASAIGGGIFRWTPGTLSGQIIAYQGQDYLPMPIAANGFEWSGDGPPPKPRLAVSNIGGFLGALINGLGDLVGAKVIRLRTFVEMLDGQPDADPEGHWPPDEFTVHRKVAHSAESIEWELASILDQQDVQFPSIRIIKDTCTHVYRRWNGTAFDYTQATCPYAGSSYFTRDGSITTLPAQDECGRKLSDCTKRFGAAPKPIRAFPGVLRFNT